MHKLDHSERLKFYEDNIKDVEEIIPHYMTDQLDFESCLDKVVMNIHLFRLIGKFTSIQIMLFF